MKQLQKIILIILLFVVPNLTAQTGPFFVDDTIGSNTFPGTFLQPFRTIQKAIDVMSTNVTFATCYIFPGIYYEQVLISSNKNSGYMVITELSNLSPVAPILDGALTNYSGIRITNASFILINALTIKSYTNGLEILGVSSNNIVMNNLIYSNSDDGINLDSDEADNNYIFNNEVKGIQVGTCSGMKIENGDNNVVRSNKVWNAQYGIEIKGSATNNYIIRNLVYSNQFNGITLNSDDADYNFILTNIIRGGNQVNGIFLENGDFNLIASNHIYNNSMYGILLNTGASANHIVNNEIFSNNDAGIASASVEVNNQIIISNRIRGKNQDYGIDLNCGINNQIYRNLIYDNEFSGIRLSGPNTNVKIINNTILRSINSNGVSWENTSSGTMYNNIILSNGNGDDFGISRTSTGQVFVAYNCIYGNNNSPTNGNLIWGPGNISLDPLVDTTGSFMIISSNSPAIDSGTNIPGITDNFLGSGPDMGWKEGIWGVASILLVPDKPPGQYIGDLKLKLTAYKDALKSQIESAAAISATIFRNNINFQSLAGTGSLEMYLSVGAQYMIRYYAVDIYNNSTPIKEGIYDLVEESEMAVYPTVVSVNKTEFITIVYKGEDQDNVDIKIYTLRGDKVKTIHGANFSTGSIKLNISELGSLISGQYIVQIKDKKAFLFLIR
ncbi:MAG: right-handed parallel beta-helix repeat-containing protein [Spirochaetes bacterium]|nr:right-handed parallel beta-helix repeat-containing protein [Spirochaetota bacterium]